MLVLCVAGLTAVSMQVRCIDAAREAARLAARGDDGSTGDAAQRIAPDGTVVQLRRDGGFVVATVTAKSTLLPGITIAAEAVAAVEPVRAERGSATLVAVAMMAVLLTITVGGVYVGSAVIARHRAQAAADLAAVAAAVYLADGTRAACAQASAMALAMNAAVTRCEVDDLDVVVTSRHACRSDGSRWGRRAPPPGPVRLTPGARAWPFCPCAA